MCIEYRCARYRLRSCMRAQSVRIESSGKNYSQLLRGPLHNKYLVSTMVWTLMRKTRRQAQSPSSTDSSTRGQRSFFGGKHKRRNIRKDSGITEATDSLCSLGSEKTDSAPWRVGTF